MIDIRSIGECQIMEGIPASPGTVIGKAFILDTERPHVEHELVPEQSTDEEIAAFMLAIEETKRELTRLRDGLATELREAHAGIFDAHLMMLEDSMILDGTIRRIREHRQSAAFALTETIGQVTSAMERTRDEYLRDRVFDIKDIERRLLLRLLGRKQRSLRHLDDEVIVLAHELAATHTASMHEERVVGFATDVGGRTSHAAIMARSLQIPAVVGLHEATAAIRQGETVILDGTLGLLVYRYDQAVFDYYLERERRHEEFERGLAALRDAPAVTSDGRRFELAANIEIPDEVRAAISHGADGIGLFRTEYLFITGDEVPSEDEQYEAYRCVVSLMAPSSVVIRTVDLGGDKFGPLGAPEPEANPFLGWRGIRYSLSHPHLMLRQLKAILRASAHGNVKIMFPMITSVNEVRDAKQVLEAAKQELRAAGKEFDERAQVGIMIETPAAAVIADFLAEEVDFFSIGSNDLVQYSLAVDRGNDRVAYLYDSYHPAVLRLIEQTVAAARRHKKWVGLCGEMAGDPLSALLLIGLGLDELSTSPALVPEIKSVIRSTSYGYARRIFAKAVKMRTGSEVRRYLEQIFRVKFPEISETEMIS
ncbi:MAG: phosphoenolpyruvate--protein phosphotransferase [Candidatus Eisenbacteria bacterium]|nr:phosphoenolpyruvate--protein phosphotransferase [Candidatus Eisenbacteria bacterium]